ncbi:MAG TPA: FadR/GntR family transcriptional regulator [Steroidobacteraceae bacterium]|jgi:GntR family transcriptional repressor for pyruvate dehydrogenase complex
MNEIGSRVVKVTEAPLRALNRAEEVARLLGERIRAGEFEVDARLPSEQIMGTQFGVSRPVIREAIARLKNEGLVRTRQGSGAFVCEWKMDSLHFDPGIGGRLESVLLIYELRKGIESEAAALASARRTRVELANIARRAKRLGATTGSPEENIKADMAFHRAIAEASHNPYYIMVLDYLHRFLLNAFSIARSNVMRDEYAADMANEHLDILDAIHRKDSAAARLAAQNHIDQARIRVSEASRSNLQRGGPHLLEPVVAKRSSGSANKKRK